MKFFHNDFFASYQIDTEAKSSLPSSSIYYHFSTTSNTVSSKLLISFYPRGLNSWIGSFEKGTLSKKAKIGVYTTPSANHALIAAKGPCYWVNVTHPTESISLIPDPVVTIISAPQVERLIVGTPWELFGYNADGLAWRSGRIAVDGMQVNLQDDRLLVSCDRLDGSSRQMSLSVTAGEVL